MESLLAHGLLPSFSVLIQRPLVQLQARIEVNSFALSIALHPVLIGAARDEAALPEKVSGIFRHLVDLITV